MSRVSEPRKSLWRHLAEWWNPPAREPLRESFTYQDWVTGWADMFNARMNWADGWSLPGVPNARRQGSDFPLVRSENDLTLIRTQSRILCGTNDYAQGFLNGVAGYVLGDGLTYRVSPKADLLETTQEYAKNVGKACQKIVDRHLKRNQWWGGEQPGLEQEFFRRTRRDGEAALKHFANDDGTVDERFIEPDMIRQPPNTTPQEWSYGIRNPVKPYPDVATHLEFYVCWDYDLLSGVKYDAEEILFYRVNVDRNIKRGMPDFFADSWTTLDLAAKLRNALGEGATQQASIAFIRQHATARKEVVEAFVSGNADFKRPEFGTGEGPSKLIDYKLHRKGTTLDIPKPLEYVEPPGGKNAPAHIQVADLLLRSAGRRWNAPEWLTSGDSSNNNYASSMTAENPFVIQIKCQQKAYCEVLKSAPWYALRHWIRTNGLTVNGRKLEWDEVKDLVEIEVTAPSPVSRERDKEANVDKIYVEMGSKSPQIVAEEQGYDWHRVVRDREEASKIQQKLAPPPLMPGGPGSNGKPQNGQQRNNGATNAQLERNNGNANGYPQQESDDRRWVRRILREAGAFDPTKHPRDKDGKFIPIGELAAAQHAGPDSPEAQALREKVHPRDREKLERRLTGGKAGKRKAAALAALKAVPSAAQVTKEPAIAGAYAAGRAELPSDNPPALPNNEPMDFQRWRSVPPSERPSTPPPPPEPTGPRADKQRELTRLLMSGSLPIDVSDRVHQILGSKPSSFRQSLEKATDEQIVQAYDVALRTKPPAPEPAPAFQFHPKIPVYVRGDIDPNVAASYGAHWSDDANAYVVSSHDKARVMKAALPNLTYTMPKDLVEFYHPELKRPAGESDVFHEHEGWLIEDNNWIGEKIKKLKGEGKDQKQAVAIALHMAKERGIKESTDAHGHEHEPGGSPKGGQFAPKGGGLSKSGRQPPVADSPTSFLVKISLREADLPDIHHDGITEIKFTEGHYIPGGRAGTEGITEAYGIYSTRTRAITLASNAYSQNPEANRFGNGNIAVFGGAVVLHEIGHNVHIAKMTDAACDEWAAISQKGTTARVSAYAQTCQGEHFAEVYREYARGGRHRKALKALEPKAYSFMQKLWRSPAMFLPEGQYAEVANFERRYIG